MPSAETATFDAGGNHDQVRPRHGQTWVSGGLDDAREICRRLAGQQLNHASMPR
jgi:hypothetical protein